MSTDEEMASRSDVDPEAGSESPAADGRSRDPAEGSGSDDQARRGRLAPNPLLATVIALVVVAAGCAGWFGWSWYAAAHDDSLSYSRMRDEALSAGEQAIKNFNTMDYRNVEQGLNVWLESSTGDLRDEVVRGREQFVRQVQEARTVTTAKVLDGAVTELNAHAGRASIIVSLELTVTPPDGAPTTKLRRLEGELTMTPSGWKLNAVGQVPAGTNVPGPLPGATPTPGQ